MRLTTCFCGSNPKDITLIGRRDERQVGKCTHCGLVRTMEVLEDYSALYTDGDTYHHQREGHIAYTARAEHDYGIAALRWKKLSGLWVGPRFLDVGCANGAFVKYAAEQGMESEGLEPNPHMAKWAAEYSARPIHTTWDSVKGRFDVVTYHDVIEHVEYPVEMLLEIRANVLRPDGLLVLDTPDADDPRFAALGVEWHHMKPLEHLYFYTEQSLNRLLERTGFTVIKVDRPIQGKIVVYARPV